MNYGGRVGAEGAKGEATLDDLGNYVPITTAGAWQVCANGATKFDARR